MVQPAYWTIAYGKERQASRQAGILGRETNSPKNKLHSVEKTLTLLEHFSVCLWSIIDTLIGPRPVFIYYGSETATAEAAIHHWCQD